jgi:hypothetical protein
MTSTYIPEEIRQRVREQAGNRCGYCLSAQEYVMGQLEIEHIFPTARGGTDDEINLWLACRLCNGYKGDQVEVVDPQTGQPTYLFNPRTQTWVENFAWSNDQIHIVGITPVGRATVTALQMNNQIALVVRGNWVRAGWHPPIE